VPIRKAILSDAKEIAKINIISWQAAYRGMLPDDYLENLSIRRTEELWKTRLTEKQVHTLVYEHENHVVGFASYGASRDEDVATEKTGEIYSIYLDPGEWRKGYGKALTNAAIASLEVQGFSNVMLWVLDKNKRGIAFYEALGFENDGAQKIEIRKNGIELKEFRFHLSLKSKTISQ